VLINYVRIKVVRPGVRPTPYVGTTTTMAPVSFHPNRLAEWTSTMETFA